jgi:hypothetical protein
MHICKYVAQSVNRTQTDIKRETCDNQTWKKHLFLYISSTDTDTFVPSLYQWVENRSIEIFSLVSHFHISVSTSTPFREFLDPVMNRFTRQTLPAVNKKHFLINILCSESVCSQKNTTGRCSFIVHSSSTVAILTTEISLCTCACAFAT